MRLLLIAYEFPPSPSPQSLRWAYLVRELAALGHEVHVLAPDIPAYGGGLPVLPAGVRVHRTYAGPLMGYLAGRARRKHVRPATLGPDTTNASSSGGGPAVVIDEDLNWKGRIWMAGLNWKGRLFERIKAVWGFSLHPDIRAEWNPWARRALKDLLETVQPDVVLASHEPANCLVLGLEAKRRKYAFVADLGDPVLAPYTPRRWRRHARRLEGRLCAMADHVIVTSEKARETLTDRHALVADRCTVITQGFDGAIGGAPVAMARTEGGPPLSLLYTGSFYDFRRADTLLAALDLVPGVRLDIASVRVPAAIQEFARANPDKLRLLGFLDHAEAVRRQRRADVLVNLANADPVQVPGKLYEYFGAARPILHIGSEDGDAVATLLKGVGRGWSCPNDAAALAAMLTTLVDKHRCDTLHHGLDMEAKTVAGYTWRRLAERVDQILRSVAPPAPGDPPQPAHTQP